MPEGEKHEETGNFLLEQSLRTDKDGDLRIQLHKASAHKLGGFTLKGSSYRRE